MTKDWHDKKESYEVLDGRGLAGDFLKTILEKAKKVRVGDGICVVQRFEPIPLYSTLEEIGFEHLTEKISNNEYRAYFYRAEDKDTAAAMETPLHPAALANLGKIDKTLGKTASQFWQLVRKGRSRHRPEDQISALACKCCWRRASSSGNAGTGEGILCRSHSPGTGRTLRALCLESGNRQLRIRDRTFAALCLVSVG